MPDVLTGLVASDGLRSVYSERSRRTDERTVSGSSEESRALKLQGEEADGWRVLKRNKTSIRIFKDKPVDRQLEDDIWCLFYRMGFKELNANRNFRITNEENAPGRQIDIFAKDNETVFIVECTHSQEQGNKSVKGLIDKIANYRDSVIRAVHSHYGRSPHLKVKFAIATRNVDWRDADRARATDQSIAIITEDDLKYFQGLTNILKSAARYQFLGRYLKGEKVEGLREQVSATRGRAGKYTFYTFLISPHDLLRIAFINHKSKTSNDGLDSYQRLVKPARLASIGKYIDDGNSFPTNIVINLKSNGLNFDINKNFGDTASGILHLPGRYGSAWVIDGQHRLYGYAYASREGENDHSVVSVLAYENMPVKEEIKMFVDINTQQVKVTRILVNEIVSSLDIDDDDPAKRLDAMCARVALSQDSWHGSPLKGRLKLVSADNEPTRRISLTGLADGISDNNLIGTVHKQGRGAAVFEPGPLATIGGESAPTMKKAGTVLAGYMGIFADALPDQWVDDKAGYIGTPLGIRALLKLLGKVIQYVERDGIRCQHLDADELIEKIEPIVSPLVCYFEKAEPSDILRFRARGSSLSSVDQNCLQMMAIIFEANPKFVFAEVQKYLENQDVEGTARAKQKIEEINRILFVDVIDRLKAAYTDSSESWWNNGIPKNVRNECDRKYNAAPGEGERWRNITFANYSEIVLNGDNWDLFKDYYSFYGKGAKASQVRWIDRMNRCKQITDHTEKGPLSREQVAYVDAVYSLVKEHVEARVQLEPKRVYLVDDAMSQEVAA